MHTRHACIHVLWHTNTLHPQVLEWSGVSLIDRSFEEVQQIIERTDDVAELVVEHATDM